MKVTNWSQIVSDFLANPAYSANFRNRVATCIRNSGTKMPASIGRFFHIEHILYSFGSDGARSITCIRLIIFAARYVADNVLPISRKQHNTRSRLCHEARLSWSGFSLFSSPDNEPGSLIFIASGVPLFTASFSDSARSTHWRLDHKSRLPNQTAGDQLPRRTGQCDRLTEYRPSYASRGRRERWPGAARSTC